MSIVDWRTDDGGMKLLIPAGNIYAKDNL